MNRKREVINPQKDFVRIVTPKRYLRVGYPMDVSEEAERVKKEHKDDVFGLLEKLGVKRISPDHRSIDKLYRELAYIRCIHKGFGGNERKIFEEDLPEWYEGAICQVGDKFVVKTGHRYPGSRGGGMFDEYDYEPPSLDVSGTHIILRVSIMRLNHANVPDRGRGMILSSDDEPTSFLIRQEYVEKTYE